MGFQQGLSGLASSSRAIDVVSNNIANSATVGFKSSSAVFADLYAASLQGSAGNVQSGIGSLVTAVRQNFSAGGTTTTNNPLDMAINGNGFFEISLRDGTRALTRNGQFDIDSEGFIVTSVGDRLLGYQADAVTGDLQINDATFGELRLPPGGVPAQATTSVGASVNLDSDSPVPAVTPLDIADPESYNFTTSTRIFDSFGGEHTMSFYFVKTANPREWEVHTSIDGAPPAGAPEVIEFDTNGVLTTGGTYDVLGIDFGNDSEILNIAVDLTESTQYGTPSVVRDLQQDGYAAGEIIAVSVDKSGVIQGRYTNGRTVPIGAVSLATVRNPNGLVSLGNNLWAESAESGQAVRGQAGTGLNGVISSGQVEDSNVDLTQELVQLIIMQRNYQANAQSIRTQDQLLQTVTNLR
ncbi:flagellar hook protein FlgE [Pseudazoarcus pumilus]|uniref:Flagellar hook protein FlgE n=1 Tax=Pseudazoarcus pumilus TaxID=2067960 RepID=A0A2I6S8I2_9RHOO|nr:flagellar hook protein FlgE [Pseudazoarcus pumilus]AUN95552.1 flagellar hook protein FlgE [Pseudazoarcus pumilus]